MVSIKKCLTVRQTAIMFSALNIFVFAASTAGLALSYLHGDELLDILKIDIHEQHEKAKTNAVFHDNEGKLIVSYHMFNLFSRMMLYLLILAGFNMALSIIALYGVLAKNSVAVGAWIVISVIIFFFGSSAVLIATYQFYDLPMFAGSLAYIFVLSAGITMYSLTSWKMILVYFMELRLGADLNGTTGSYGSVLQILEKKMIA